MGELGGLPKESHLAAVDFRVDIFDSPVHKIDTMRSCSLANPPKELMRISEESDGVTKLVVSGIEGHLGFDRQR
jgi:hypothetical protein